MIMLIATGRKATARTDEVVTSGSVGIPVEVSLNEDFDGLQAVLVFACDGESADVPLLGQSVTIPPQVIATSGKFLMMGVYATRADGTVVIPTVWAEVGIVREGAKPSGIDPAEPTPSWAAQVQQWAHDAATSATEAVETAGSVREDMDKFNTTSAEVLADAHAATVAASAGATVANQAAADLRAAAERGDFDGADGRQGEPGPQGAEGKEGKQGPKGDAYEITDADYAEIAGMVEGTIQPTIDAAIDAAASASQAASTANDAAERAEDAIEAIGDISELAVPLMSESTRGGAKLGEGLEVMDGTLTLSANAHESTGEVRGSIAALTAKGWAEQTVTDDPPSPSPDYPAEIRVARGHTIDGKSGRYVDVEVQGKNLLSDVASDWSVRSGFPSGRASRLCTLIECDSGQTLNCHFGVNNSGLAAGWCNDGLADYVSLANMNNLNYTFTNSNYKYLCVSYTTTNGNPATDMYSKKAIIERGDTFTGYVPYFHHTISVPLPSRGWVASLPDGTADALTLNGAGKWEWECKTNAKTMNGTETWAAGMSVMNGSSASSRGTLISDMSNVRGNAITKYFKSTSATAYGDPDNYQGFCTTYSSNFYAVFPHDMVGITSDMTAGQRTTAIKAWIAAHPFEVLYKLATPTTESGYTEIPMPSIPSEAVVTCPELDALGVRYLIGDDVRAMAEQWYARAQSEYEDRITALEQAVAELIAS